MTDGHSTDLNRPARPAAKVLICPYCGATQAPEERCRACGGVFEPLSRQATHNAMGPWFVRQPERPFQPGCSYETLVRLVERGRITKYTVLRGPTTRQFWTVARRTPGVAHLLGYCHACDAEVDPADHGCPDCGVPFGAYLDRNYLGLPEVRPLPGEAPGDEAAALRDGWAAPRLTPRGLSSFATDADLVGAPGGAAVSAARAADDPAATGSGAETTAGDESWLTRPAVRSMLRRIERQQRTIRILTVLVIVVALMGALFNVLVVARGVERAPAIPAPPGTAAAPDAARDLGDPTLERSAAARTDAPTGPSVGAPADATPEATASDRGLAGDLDAPGATDVPTAPTKPLAPPAWQQEWDEALALGRTATDGERPLDERLAAAAAAIDRLRTLAAAHPAPDGPPDLDARLRELEDEHERLTLRREFFR